jgi:hypothetical protein
VTALKRLGYLKRRSEIGRANNNNLRMLAAQPTIQNGM